MIKRAIKDSIQIRAKRVLYLLIFVLIFEGLMRKLTPGFLSLLIFFIKDLFCIYGLFFVIIKAKFVNLLIYLNRKIKNIILLFIPLVLMDLFRGGPVLAVFGIKQYLLYCVIAFLVPIAFPPPKISEFRNFLFALVVMLFPTVAIATLQNSLPATHWLNLSVDGGSLEGFSAGGRLRVSSTFSFTGQFSWFLTMVCSCLALLLMMPAEHRVKPKSILKKVISMGAVLCLFIGAFITGGRTAVLGCGFILSVGFVLASLRSPGKLIKRAAIAVVLLLLATGAIRVARPEYFLAYDTRSQGYRGYTQSEEMQQRVEDGFLSWTRWGFKQDASAIILGNGIGVVSNGSEKLSSYASYAKQFAFVESDADVTFWEGGIYLMLIWYSFRIWLIFYCFKLWKSIKNKDWAVASSFLLGYIVLNAPLSAIGKQPPLNLWLWFIIGLLIAIKIHDEYHFQQKTLKKRALVYN